MVAFLRATLGFEPEIMKEGEYLRGLCIAQSKMLTMMLSSASERLSDAENTASTDHRRAQKDSHAYRSSIYPPGSEFALCHAQTQLMSAVVAVLNESLTESIRGFYKLRKAYITLDGILAAEADYMKRRHKSGVGSPSVESLRSKKSTDSTKGMPGGFSNGLQSQTNSNPGSTRASTERVSAAKTEPSIAANKDAYDTSYDEDDDDDDFHDAYEDPSQAEDLADIVSNSKTNGGIPDMADLSMSDDSRPTSKGLPVPAQLPVRHGLLDHDPDSDVFANPIDVFIHSGANLWFGLILVMISMIPPAFGKLLFIIGFHGDKDRGIRMLWQASKFHNVNGAMAGLIVLGYYNTLVGFSDIIPDTDSANLHNPVEGYPKERCHALLAEMRRRHPKSHLWLLEEARMQATSQQLSTAISTLENSTRSPLKQVEALEMFEKSLNAMYIHNYGLCTQSFIACVSLNNWSHALYYYIAGAAQLELYRLHKLSDPPAAAVYAKKASELLRTAPNHAGKKKFMARQLPFDVLVSRKVRKWEARAQEWGIPFVDAVGISPIEEMIFFWNGYKRMDRSQLETSLERLRWSEVPATNAVWSREGADEKAVLALLRGATLRNLNRLDEARATFEHGVLKVDRMELKGGLRDDWTAPAAHYEIGVICWLRRGESAKENKGLEVEERWVAECEGWVEKAAKWESYELDARIGLKITTAQDTLRRWREAKGRIKTG